MRYVSQMRAALHHYLYLTTLRFHQGTGTSIAELQDKKNPADILTEFGLNTCELLLESVKMTSD